MSIKRRELVVRGGLLLLAGEALVIGVHALFFPKYFYNQFLFGRGWVQMLPPYNEHITRDLGALYLGFFVILAYAVWKLSKDLVNGAILGFVAATVPHMIFHIVHADDAPLLFAPMNCLSDGIGARKRFLRERFVDHEDARCRGIVGRREAATLEQSQLQSPLESLCRDRDPRRRIRLAAVADVVANEPVGGRPRRERNV